jgi:uncharacterized protein
MVMGSAPSAFASSAMMTIDAVVRTVGVAEAEGKQCAAVMSLCQ